MIQRVPCKTCGDLIHPDIAVTNDGLCMPCKSGYEQQIENGKKLHEQERRYEQCPGRLHWLDLVNRVHHGTGFDALPAAEKTYYAVWCLIGEVNNGGFYQFFSNTSGAHYARALEGLTKMEAVRSAQLVIQAKQLLFESQAVPADSRIRNDSLHDIEKFESGLDAVDTLFFQDPDKLGERCEQFARQHGLY